MKNEPRWRCVNDKSHFIKMRIGDLKLPLMAEKIPSKKARREVDQYFSRMMKENEPKKTEQSKRASICRRRTGWQRKKLSSPKKKEDGQMNLFNFFIEK